MKPSRSFAAEPFAQLRDAFLAKRPVAFRCQKSGTSLVAFPHLGSWLEPIRRAACVATRSAWTKRVATCRKTDGCHAYSALFEWTANSYLSAWRSCDFVSKRRTTVTDQQKWIFPQRIQRLDRLARAPGRALREQCAPVARRRDTEGPRLQPRRTCASGRASDLASSERRPLELLQRLRCSVTQPSRQSVRTWRNFWPT